MTNGTPSRRNGSRCRRSSQRRTGVIATFIGDALWPRLAARARRIEEKRALARAGGGRQGSRQRTWTPMSLCRRATKRFRGERERPPSATLLGALRPRGACAFLSLSAARAFWAILASENGEWGNGRIRHAAQAAGTSVGGSAQISGTASRSRATRQRPDCGGPKGHKARLPSSRLGRMEMPR